MAENYPNVAAGSLQYMTTTSNNTNATNNVWPDAHGTSITIPNNTTWPNSQWGTWDPTGSGFYYTPIEATPEERRAERIKLLPRGDIDAPEFCTRCGQALEAPSYPAEVVFDPYSGRPAKTTICPGFPAEPEKHDGWVIPA